MGMAAAAAAARLGSSFADSPAAVDRRTLPARAAAAAAAGRGRGRRTGQPG